VSGATSSVIPATNNTAPRAALVRAGTRDAQAFRLTARMRFDAHTRGSSGTRAVRPAHARFGRHTCGPAGTRAVRPAHVRFGRHTCGSAARVRFGHAFADSDVASATRSGARTAASRMPCPRGTAAARGHR
jgi:hypothetical protein